VTAVGVSPCVGVVLKKINLTADALGFETAFSIVDQPLKDPIPSAIVGQKLRNAVTLRCCVFRVTAYIQVEP
jgi:hypothetical protein